MPTATLAPKRELQQTPRSDEWLVAGRPIEDRSFEAVETAACAAVGLALGGVLGGPVGAAVGALVGGSAGLVAGEAIERAIGRPAQTTDAEEPRA